MMGRQNNQSIPGTRLSMEAQLPEARVVLGKHAPDWASARARPAHGNAISYERMRAPMSTTLLAAINGFWPVIVIVSMGLALVWGGALANSP